MIYWNNLSKISPTKYTCGYCNSVVSSDLGLSAKPCDVSYFCIHICPECILPTSFVISIISKSGGLRKKILQQNPPCSFGSPVNNLPDTVKSLYNEARRCVGSQCYTASVMICRKILMHIAVEKGEKPNLGFRDYIDYLDKKNYLPRDSQAWIDYIRQQGNEANHEITLKNEQDAKQLVEFIEMLIKLIYEFPARLANHGP